MVEFIECVRACKAEGLSRLETLRRLAKLDGVYCARLLPGNLQ